VKQLNSLKNYKQYKSFWQQQQKNKPFKKKKRTKRKRIYTYIYKERKIYIYIYIYIYKKKESANHPRILSANFSISFSEVFGIKFLMA
jgi:hypothetical protein